MIRLYINFMKVDFIFFRDRNQIDWMW